MDLLLLNPYFGLNFAEFVSTLFFRTLHWFAQPFGAAPLELAPDELQLLILFCLSGSTALIGTFLHLRKMAMLANSLSHTIVLGLALVFLGESFFSGNLLQLDGIGGLSFTELMAAALVSALFTSFLTHFLSDSLGIERDASIGLVFSLLFACGILLITLFARNAHIGSEVIMGNLDSTSIGDLHNLFWILIANGLYIAIFFKELLITTFDPTFARLLGYRLSCYHYGLMCFISLNCVNAFRAVGLLMLLAFFIIPPITARLLVDRLIPMIAVAMGIGILASFTGVGLARHFLSAYGLAFSTASLVVVILGLIFIITAIRASK
ncbi:MAG: metal ABC transporter permease [Chlamydiia bacterium]|nr:metal ABC transporter permease [Chlamydiia bacterium]